ncbi:hypothetical protein V6N11_005028 [Hibiscus sabdariffa]|uniref:Uncharacterized protein n=1 Tax=Hibiscus sabdariffa TaxID=183260 RepID=A0ABR2NHI0_9ROSI
MPTAQRQNRGVEKGSSKKSMGSRFEILEDEGVVVSEGAEVKELDDPSVTKLGEAGVTLEGLGSEKRIAGRSTGSPHKREVVVEGWLVDSGKG